MKYFRLLLFLLFSLLFLQIDSFAQKRLNEDSLWKVYKTVSAVDSNRLNAIHNLTLQMIFVNPDSAIILANDELILARKLKSERGIADAFSSLGVANINKEEYKNALDNLNQALAIREKTNDKKGKAVALNNIGIVYNYEGDIVKAIDYYEQSMKIKLEIGDMPGVAAAYSNLGLIYSNEHMDERALEYYLRSLHIRDSLQDKRGMEDSYAKLASYYGVKNQLEKSKEYTIKSIELCIVQNHKRTLGKNYENLGLTYYRENNLDSAEKYYTLALNIRTEMGDENGIADSYYDLGILKQKVGENARAILFCEKSLQLAERSENILLQQDDCDCLSKAYAGAGDYKKAYSFIQRAQLFVDSLNTLEKSKTISRKILQYEFEKRAIEDSLRIAKESEVKDLKAQQNIRQQKIYTVVGIVGFVLMVIIAFVLFRGFRQKQKSNEELEFKNGIITEQKAEVENQKAKVEEKNKAMLDSIHYAERIQKSLLPTEKFIDKNLKRLNKKG